MEQLCKVGGVRLTHLVLKQCHVTMSPYHRVGNQDPNVLQDQEHLAILVACSDRAGAAAASCQDDSRLSLNWTAI